VDDAEVSTELHFGGCRGWALGCGDDLVIFDRVPISFSGTGMNGLVRQIAGAWLLAIMGGGAVLAGEPVNHHEPITVRVLDGRAGLPLARVHLTLIAGYDERDLHLGLWQEVAITDSAGSAQVPDSLINFPYLQVMVGRHSMCIGDVSKSRFSMERIRFSGLNSPNRCGVYTVGNLSGVFVVFAKAKGSDRRAAKGGPLLAAETRPEAAASIAQLSLHGGPTAQPSEPIRLVITAAGAAETTQTDSRVTGDGLSVDEGSAKLPAVEPGSGELSEWMCEEPRAR